MKIGIIGLGVWGSALKSLAERAGHKVIDDLSAAKLWLVATSAADFRTAIKQSHSFYKNQPIIICTKGMEPETHLFMSEILADILPESLGSIGVLSGPQFAAEVKAGIPTGSTLAGPAKVRNVARKVLGEFYLEETGDIIGAELCGCGKNASAVVAGYYSIKAAGENERAMMLARAWSDVADFGNAIGAKMRTFIGLCGIGDLFLSAISATSRNFSAGVAIAKGEPLVGTVEGLSALKGIVFRAEKIGVKMPVLNLMKSFL